MPVSQTGAVEGYGPASYGESFADVYDDWYRGLADPGSCARRVADLAAGGVVLELGVGTGRLALALIDHGARVVGLDVSRPMLSQLTSKPGGRDVPAVQADMAAIPFAPGQFQVVLVAFNTFFNLTGPGAQPRCLADAAEVLAPGGWLAIETIVVPDTDRPVQGVDVGVIELDRLVLTASRLDPVARTITGQHVDFTDQGVRLRPWHLRYLTLAELDGLAAGAGFELAHRWADWDGRAFDDGDDRQVSIYRRHPDQPTPT